MMKNKYASFFTALKKHPQLTKEDAVRNFSNGQTSSLKDLDHWELQELVRRLNNLTPNPSPKGDGKQYPGGEKADKMRKAIIAIFKRMDKTTANAIAWAEKQGVKGHKKQFNSYTTGELYVLIQIAEKVQQDWEKGIRKRTSEGLKK